MTGVGAGAERDHDVLARIDELADDPPAVVNLLVHGGRPSGDVFAATLVDLATRGHVGLEMRSGGVHFYRSPQSAEDAADTVLPFETLVLDLIREQTGDGAVPAASVTLGIHEEADEWWGQFSGAVIADAGRRRYLSGTKVTATLVGIGLFAVVTLALMIYASAHHESDFAWVAATAAFVAFGLVGYVVSDGDELLRGLSRQGRRRAGEWIGVRDALSGVGGFAPVPAGSVTVWGANLAYAIALGVAPEATADLPLGPDDGSRVWVRRAGGWRQVRIRAPWWLPPGWGRPPWMTTLVGLGLAGSSLVVMIAVAAAGGDGWGIVVGLASVGLLWGGSQLGFGIADLVAPPVRAVGPVVAVQARRPPVGPWRDWFATRYTIVVDDGTAAELPALRIREGDLDRVDRGVEVGVVRTRYLRHVVTLDLR